ncbi:MAG TPA: NADH-quinone oxidoreductase subunit M [Anaerolineae bacterium]|nr:NADH-quinone oxidoreductase subunit M [Anaerolineae bacterium]
MDDLTTENLLLNFLIYFPLLAGFVVLLLPSEEKNLIRRLSLIFSLVPMVPVLMLWFAYDRVDAGMQFQMMMPWFETIGANYHIGVDGVSLAMMLLTAILTPLAILASFNVEERPRVFMFLFLVLQTAMFGLFASLDLIIFFIFWEFGLVPMYFLIKFWGGKDRDYASFKFFIYTMAGSLGLLLSIQVMGLSMGTFDIPELMRLWPNAEPTLPVVGLDTGTVKMLAYFAFLIAFAIKIPVWPFHTWLPDAHTQAPTAGSMILAGVLLKLGAYGFLRLVVPLFPAWAYQTAGLLATLGMLSVVLGGFAAYGQWDFKRLVAYSSINHMGFVVLGIAVYAYVYGYAFANQGMVPGEQLTGDAILATSGAVLQMFNHGLSAAAMFFMVGVIYERAHTRDLKKFGGIWAVMPMFGALLIFASMASLGLPGLNGFVSEFMIVRGVFGAGFLIQIGLSMIGLLMTGAYILKGIGEVLHGPLKPEWKDLTDMTLREHLVMWPLMILILSLGVWPRWLLAIINDTVSHWF